MKKFLKRGILFATPSVFKVRPYSMRLQEAQLFIILFFHGNSTDKEHMLFLRWIFNCKLEEFIEVVKNYEELLASSISTVEPSPSWINSIEARIDNSLKKEKNPMKEETAIPAIDSFEDSLFLSF